MAIAELKLMVNVQNNKRVTKTRQEKGLFGPKTVTYQEPPPVKLYIDMTDYNSGATVRHNIFEGISKEKIVTYPNWDSSSSSSYHYWIAENGDFIQIKRNAMKFIALLSEQGWKVRQASTIVMSRLDRFQDGLEDGLIQKMADGQGDFRPIIISTIDEP